ncbi:hypothetical protein FA95DRAFT_826698 [Auriscalpium vulgare]|uniref:Uncharacterized protein n=1 Tax=Auriscalpium vulgare TaxID=40419 RepID=A0ACB8R992_9AGAM|nr:hypothetical protein FA95DRAFT_826698 [Auriscalpium vulgare]
MALSAFELMAHIDLVLGRRVYPCQSYTADFVLCVARPPDALIWSKCAESIPSDATSSPRKPSLATQSHPPGL